MTRTTLLWVVWAAAWAGLAAWNAVSPPAAARLRPAAGDWRPGWLKPRPDAIAAKTRWLSGGLAGVALVVGLWDLGPLSLLLGGTAVPVVAIFLGRLERGRDQDRDTLLRLQLPGALDLMAACLEAGLPLRRATAVVGGLSPPVTAGLLKRVSQGIEVGLSDAEAWLTLADDPIAGPIARDVARAANWGTTVSALLTEHAHELRQAGESEAKTKARAVGVRTVLPLSLCYLPAFFLLGLVPMLATGALSLLG
ncbi:MAG: type II secretion system F family protein [Propionibacteriaceae bacterium]|jgi:pilus assembly protein TadC|nr:type II secretion system F family protein [Propionibacteriaceae bacterium]